MLTGAGGFRMGPFTLMDLIGHDVNEAVTRSVWTAFGHDPRFAPSLAQRSLVEAGWLGRKAGRGVYPGDGAPAAIPALAARSPKVVIEHASRRRRTRAVTAARPARPARPRGGRHRVRRPRRHGGRATFRPP